MRQLDTWSQSCKDCVKVEADQLSEQLAVLFEKFNDDGSGLSEAERKRFNRLERKYFLLSGHRWTMFWHTKSSEAETFYRGIPEYEKKATTDQA